MKKLKQLLCRHRFEIIEDTTSKTYDFKSKSYCNSTKVHTERCKKCGVVISKVQIDAPKANLGHN